MKFTISIPVESLDQIPQDQVPAVCRTIMRRSQQLSDDLRLVENYVPYDEEEQKEVDELRQQLESQRTAMDPYVLWAGTFIKKTSRKSSTASTLWMIKLAHKAAEAAKAAK